MWTLDVDTYKNLVFNLLAFLFARCPPVHMFLKNAQEITRRCLKVKPSFFYQNNCEKKHAYKLRRLSKKLAHRDPPQDPGQR
jgi:hypothetical protein